jgi:hypothetical protein
VIRLLADSNLSHHFVAACLRLERQFPIIHIADWMNGKHRVSKDPVLLEVMRQCGLVLVSFDRRTMAMHAAQLTRGGSGHAGIILFRRSVSQMDHGKQSRLLVAFWTQASGWDWSDRIERLPPAAGATGSCRHRCRHAQRRMQGRED